MKFSTLFFVLMAVAGATAAFAGCATNSSTPVTLEQPPPPTSTPPAKLLYESLNGTFYEYRLPLTQGSKPILTLPEWPGLPGPPQIAADQYGNVALSSPQFIRFYRKPIVSFDRSHAYLQLKLTPAITQIGQSGADLVDIEYDPNENLWLLNNLGPGLSELRAPITKSSVAAVTIGFGVPGTKTAQFTILNEARFDINAALYVYASTSSGRSRLFKVSFPYAKPPGTTGLNLAIPDFVDASEWPPSAPVAPSLLLGQYDGALHSPKPGSPPSPPVDAMAQFPQPFNPIVGRFPDAHVDQIAGALTADTYRYSFYSLNFDDGTLNVYALPMRGGEKPKLTLPCVASAGNCTGRPEYLFLAP